MYPTFDAAASLRVWAVETTLAGRLLRIPPLPAADWLPALMAGNTLRLRELLEDCDLSTALMDEDFTLAELDTALQFLAESAAGRSIKTTVIIASSAAARWDVIGADLARAGMRFDEISLGAALDAIYGSLLRHMDESGQKEFNRLLMDVVESRPARRLAQRAEPLPASVLRSLEKRPKTVLRRPPDHQGVQNAQPTPLPERPADNGRVATPGPTTTPGGGVHPRR